MYTIKIVGGPSTSSIALALADLQIENTVPFSHQGIWLVPFSEDTMLTGKRTSFARLDIHLVSSMMRCSGLQLVLLDQPALSFVEVFDG